MYFIVETFSINRHTTFPSSSRIATLYHKISNNSVKFCSIIITTSCKFSKISTSNWYMFPIEFYHYFTHSCFKCYERWLPVFIRNTRYICESHISIYNDISYSVYSSFRSNRWSIISIIYVN